MRTTSALAPPPCRAATPRPVRQPPAQWAPAARSAPAARDLATLTVATLAVVCAVGVACAAGAVPRDRSGTAYHDDQALAAALGSLAESDRRAHLTTLARSAGGREIPLLTIAPPGPGGAERHPLPAGPAILVIGDPLGEAPVATEAALRLARLLVGGGPSARDVGDAAPLTWHILPRANPDGAARFFADPRLADGANARAVDDDRDGESGEDGADDLDADGLIATMLRPHPAGEWVLTPDDPPLPKLADPSRGERGLYQRWPEGRDDDGDGLFNEDGAGGVVPGRNFPHAFRPWEPRHGVHPASEPESRAILRFANDHPEIAMVLVLGPANALLRPPSPPPLAEGETDGDRRLSLPAQLASRYGFDPLSEYTLDDLVASLRTLTGNRALQAGDVLAMLKPGPALQVDPADLDWWLPLARAYADSLRAAGLDGARVPPAPSGPGSVEEWAYFQLGVPSLAIDFWSAPLPLEASADSGAAGAAMDGTAALADSLATPGTGNGAARAAADSAWGGPPPPSPQPDPAERALAAFARERPESSAYLAWREVEAGAAGRVLVGGPAPFALRSPPPSMLDSLLSRQVPLLLDLPDWLPRLEIAAVTVTPRGRSVHEVTAQVAGIGRIPYPTAQGRRTRRSPPVVVTISGAEVLEGRARRALEALPGVGAAEVRWLVRGRAGAEVVVEATAPPLGRVSRSARLETEGGSP